jgi:ribonuclease VapC
MSEAPVRYVLDSSAVIAFLRGEPGAQRVGLALENTCFISAVNQIEVLTKLLDKGLTPEAAASAFMGLEIAVISLDEAQAAQAAWLRSNTRHLGLSLGDRACLVLAQHRQATLLTADRAWTALPQGTLDITVELIRP